MAARSKRQDPIKQLDIVFGMLGEATSRIENADRDAALSDAIGQEKLEAFVTWREDRHKNLEGKMTEIQSRVRQLEEDESDEKARLAKAIKLHSQKKKRLSRIGDKLEKVDESIQDTDKRLEDQKRELESAESELAKVKSWMKEKNPDGILFESFLEQQSMKMKFYQATTGVFFGEHQPEKIGNFSGGSSLGDDTVTSNLSLVSGESGNLCGYVVTTNPEISVKKIRTFDFSKEAHSQFFITNEIWKMVRELNS